MAEKIKDDMHSSKGSGVFEKQAQKYQGILLRYTQSLWNMIKTLLKSKLKGAKQDTLRWIGAAIITSYNRSKLGHSLSKFCHEYIMSSYFVNYSGKPYEKYIKRLNWFILL